MPRQYCPSCGSGNEYAISTPKFCNQCGASFDAPVAVASIAVAQSQKSKRLLVPYGRDDDYEEESGEELRIPRKLDVEFEVEPNIRVSLGSVMKGTSESVQIDKGGKKISKRALTTRVQDWRAKLQTTQRHEIGGAGGND